MLDWIRMNEKPARQTGSDLVLERDPVIEAYKKDVDRTLLRENLERSVAERLANLVDLQRLAEEARRAGRRSCSFRRASS
jgi:hypothetical protein